MKINSGQSFYRKPALPTWFTYTAFSCSKVMDKTIGEKLDKNVAIDKNHGPACMYSLPLLQSIYRLEQCSWLKIMQCNHRLYLYNYSLWYND